MFFLEGVRKVRKIRKSFHDYIPFILIIVLITTSLLFSYGKSYADNFKVLGDSEGLKIIPKDTKMFDLNNLNPGDTYETEIILENKYKDCYLEIFLRTERISAKPGEGEADLFKQLKLKVYLDDELIYNGDMKDFSTTNTSLGTLEKNKHKKMRVVVHLPGPETGNEFQGKELTVNWIFTAQSDCPIEPEEPEEPQEPEEPEEPEEPGPEEPEEPSEEETDKPKKEELEEDKPIIPDLPEGGEKPEKPKTAEIQETPKKALSIIGRLVQTGATPDTLYFALGGLMLVLGMGVYKKKK